MEIAARLCGRLALSVLILPLGTFAPGTAAAQKTVYPGAHWDYARAALPSEVRRRVDDYVRALDTTGLVIVQHGLVVYEYGDVRSLSYLASSRKSVLAILYGPYVANGTIRLDSTLQDLGMTDNGGLLPLELHATVRNLISARSGIYHPASNPGDSAAVAPARGSKEPGTYWLYNNWDFNAAGAVFERMTGKSIFEAIKTDLAEPIGMQDFQLTRQHMQGDLSRSQYPAYHIWLSTRDMARVGYLMLRQGRWRDKQVIPSDWVRQISTVVTPRKELHDFYRDGPFGYGYMWWVWDGAAGPFEGAYTSWGSFGQYITILPKLDMVIANKTLPVNRDVEIGDYLHLLERITGKVPASESILRVLWKYKSEEAPALATTLKQQNPSLNESDLYAAGMSLLRAGRVARAAQVFRLNSAMYEGSSRTWLALSTAQSALGKFDSARQCAKKALALKPDNTWARLQLFQLGGVLDGHSKGRAPSKQLALGEGMYKGEGKRYLIRRVQDHLRITVYEGDDVTQDFLAFIDNRGTLYSPSDGSTLSFSRSPRPTWTMTGVQGRDSWIAVQSTSSRFR